MSADEDAFLSRWSRRKLEARREQAPSEEGPPPAVPELPQPAAVPATGESELTPEDLAALPKVEELTAESDISAFLRKGVPEALRNAALRRIWALDPTVRDYVGDARDYAYDWNVPGGVPGNGPLSPTSDAPGMIERLFSKGAAEPQELFEREPPKGAEGEVANDSPPEGVAPQEPQLASKSVRRGEPAGAREAPAADPAVESGPDSPLRVPPRRHGGAIPG